MATYIYPCSEHRVSDDFDAHVARGSVNPGTDFICSYGSPVVAVKSGTVVVSDSNPSGSGGRVITINHGDGTVTDYLHLSVVQVGAGSSVAQGRQIALSGGSGYGSDRYYGPHLHLALKIGGRNVDFEKYVGGGSVPGGIPVDGVLGAATISALQTRLKALGFYSGVIDGVIDPGRSLTVLALQKYLNSRGARLTEDGSGLWQNGTFSQTNKALQVHCGGLADGIYDVPVSEGIRALQRRLNAGTF